MPRHDLQKTIKSSEHFFSRIGNDPYFDWACILGVSFVAALVFVTFSTRLFLDVSGDAVALGAQVTTSGKSAANVSSPLDTTDLVNVISIFASKKAQEPVFAATYPGPADPAIPIKTAKASVAAKTSAPAK